MHKTLGWLLGCLVMLTAVASAASATGARPQPLAADVWWVAGEFAPGQQPDGNSVMLRGPESWLIFDTGRHAAHTLRLLDFARASRLPIEAVVNSHWHLDHVGGNARLRAAVPGLRVYASAAIEHAMGSWLADYRRQLLQMIESDDSNADAKRQYRSEIALIDAGRALYPDVRVRKTLNWRIAGRPLRLGLQTDAVTAGDVWLYDRKSRLLLAGDLVTLPVPFFDTACPQRWLQALRELDQLDFKRVVPGHGPVLTHGEFSGYVQGFDQLLLCAASDRSVSDCSAEWQRATAAWVPADEQARAGQMLDYHFTSLLRAPDGGATRYCPRLASS